jgi:hypothetical protein
MTLDNYIEIQLVRVKISRKPIDRQILQWLLELRTLRAQVRQIESENKRLRHEYEKILLQSARE